MANPINIEGMRATRADVAKLAGVSETIVSYVVNNNRYVAEEKRRRVEQAIAELNYRPNAIARALRKKTSHQILLIGDAVMDEYYGEILSMLDQTAYDKGYLVSLCQYHNVDSYLARVMSGQFDGIIINSAGFKEEYIRQIAAAGIPVVLFLSKKYEAIPAGVATIDSGLRQGVRMGVEMLYRQGARHIVYLAEPLKKTELAKDIRFLAFREVCRRQGLTDDQIMERTFADGRQEGWEPCFSDYLAKYPEIDAVFARNDRLAAIAAKLAQVRGICIPKDMMILGVDNSSLSRLMTPTITTIEQQKEEMSRAAIRLIEEMNAQRQMVHKNEENRQKNNENRQRLFTTRLIERESTKR